LKPQDAVKFQDFFLFENVDLNFDPTKIIGEFATSKFKQEMVNFDSIVSNTLRSEILKVQEIKPNFLLTEFSEEASKTLKDFIDFEFKETEEKENLTFKSLYDRIDEERERVAQAIFAWCEKIQSLFLRLRLIVIAFCVVFSVAIFSQQFGGNRDLPVA